MKLVKRLIYLFLIFIFLALGTVFVVVTFYKKEMASMLTTYLKESYGITLRADDVNVSFLSNWPNASVQFKNVYLANDLCKHEPLLKAGSVSLSFDLKKLLNKQFIVKSIAVKDAEITLVKDSSGIKNFEFKKSDAESAAKNKSSISFEIGSVSLKNTAFSFLNKQQDKSIEFTLTDNDLKLKQYADGVDVKLTGLLFVKGLLFKRQKGAFLDHVLTTIDLDARVCLKRKEIFIHPPSFITIKNQRFDVSSFIDLNEATKRLVLSVETKKVNYYSGISLLNKGIKKALMTIQINKPLNVKALIIAKLGIPEEPIVVVKVSSLKNEVTIGNSKIPYSDVDFTVSVISLDSSLTKGNAETAKVIIKPLKGKIYEFPFTGSVTIRNFSDPFISIHANLFVDVKKIPFKPGQEFVLNGSANAVVSYSGPVNKLNQEEFLDHPMTLNAKVKFNSVSYREKVKPYVYQVNGEASVNNKELSFNRLMLKMDGGTFSLKGSVDNFVKYALGRTNGFKANLNATTDYFDMTAYVVKNADTLKLKSHNDDKFQSVKDESKFEFNVTLAAKKLLIRKVDAFNAFIDLHYKEKLLELKSLKVNTCNGSLSANGTIYDVHKINASVKTENINVKQMFEQFENFGQKAIESKNLEGHIFLDAKVKMDLDEKMEVIGKTIKGEVHLKLKDGHLLDYEPLQNISNFIFRNRDFQNISFTEINETFHVDGFKMDIEEMEIASNVLNLFMSGTYHFKEESNINVLIPWNNLKRRGKNYIPKSSGQTAENSKGLKLNYSGLPNKLKLSLGNK
ncbi:MAG: AsmA-like C-terminal region-containing protein [Bacteroidota bacterium]